MLFALTFHACEIINPSEEIPFYIRIDSISYVDSSVSPPNVPRANTQRIVDAWVYADGEYIGTFELPAKVPILKGAGSRRIGVRAGVINNGQTNDRVQYPFLGTYQITIPDVQLGETYTINPRVSYNELVAFPDGNSRQFFETFDGPGYQVKIDTNLSTVDTLFITTDPSIAFDGKTALITMNQSGDVFLAKTDRNFVLNTKLEASYLEMNFRTDVLLKVGIYAKQGASVKIVPFINLNPTGNQWRKVYLQLASTLSAYPGHVFDFYFTAAHDTTLTQTTVLMDNINLIGRP